MCIRDSNYDMTEHFNDYRREMVLLYIPFRNEENDVLAENKFVQLYEDNQDLILQRRKESESNLDNEKTLEICRQLYRDTEVETEEMQATEEMQNEVNVVFESDPYEHLLHDPESIINADMQHAALCKLGAVAKRRENIISFQQFYDLMRLANTEQKDILMHIIYHLQNTDDSLLQIFFTGPAGCGKTFVTKLIMDIYNRFTDTDGWLLKCIHKLCFNRQSCSGH